MSNSQYPSGLLLPSLSRGSEIETQSRSSRENGKLGGRPKGSKASRKAKP